MEDFKHFVGHLFLECGLNHLFGHLYDKNYFIKSVFFSLLSAVNGTDMYLILKIVMLFCFLVCLVLNRPIRYNYLRYWHEVIHISVACFVFYFFGPYNERWSNVGIGVVFYGFQILWQQDNAHDQMMRLSLIILTCSHLAYWWISNETVLCSMFPQSVSCYSHH